MDLFNHKLDNLAGGDFREFHRSLKTDRLAALASLSGAPEDPHSSQLEGDTHVKNWPPQNLEASTMNLKVGMAESVDSVPYALKDHMGQGQEGDDDESKISSNAAEAGPASEESRFHQGGSSSRAREASQEPG